MRKPFLQVTYQDGQPEIAYLSLSRKSGEKSVESERVEPEMVLDFNAEGKLIGIEILDPHEVSFEAINDVLQKTRSLTPERKNPRAYRGRLVARKLPVPHKVADRDLKLSPHKHDLIAFSLALFRCIHFGHFLLPLTPMASLFRPARKRSNL